LSRTDPPAVLVTRPLPQGERTARALTERGYCPILAPMLRIEPVTPPTLPDMLDVQAILATSANGIERLAALTPARGATVLAVGTRTADRARALGFEAVLSADGGAPDLLPLIRNLDPRAGMILHPRGEDAAHTFEALEAEGFTLQDLILYRAVKADALPAQALTAHPHAALVYSARTAEALAAVLAHEPRFDPGALTVIGISQAALAPLTGIPGQTHAAPEPTEAAILDTLSHAIPVPRKN